MNVRWSGQLVRGCPHRLTVQAASDASQVSMTMLFLINSHIDMLVDLGGGQWRRVEQGHFGQGDKELHRHTTSWTWYVLKHFH